MVRTDRHDEQLLLDLLNTTPVAAGGPVDLLEDAGAAAAWARSRGGVGTPAETRRLRLVRDRLQAVVRGVEPAGSLSSVLRGARLTPVITGGALDWRLDVLDEDRRLAVRAVLAWGRLQRDAPGRLRGCANAECRLFLLDRSRPNTARWCSMKVCGNRLKARRHYQRTHAD